MTQKPNRKGRGLQWIEEHLSHQGQDCLQWPFSRSAGYANFSMGGRCYWVHRYICELVHGPAPTPKHQASHSCGRGHLGCVNPRHVSWKSQSENQLDRRLHGTQYLMGARGTLSDEQVEAIRALKGRKPQSEIAAMFGLRRSTISAIMIGRTHANKLRGVQKRGNRWRAQIKVNRQDFYLGSFSTEEEARAAFRAATEQARAAQLAALDEDAAR